MENSKSGIIGFIVIGVLVIGGAWYGLMYKTSVPTIKKVESAASCYSTFTKEKFGLVAGKPVTMTFEYPCGWSINTTTQGWVSVADLGGKASFSWPILDIDIHDFADKGTFMTTVNGVEYMGHRYATATKTAEFLYVPITDGTEMNGMTVMYTDETSKAEVYHILSTMKF